MSTRQPTPVFLRRGRRHGCAIAATALAAATALGVAGAPLAGPALSDAQQVIAALQLAPGELHVIGGIADGGRAYRVGEPIVLSAEVDRAAYVAMLQVTRAGDTTEVFPNRAHPDALLAANAPLRIPVSAPAALNAGDHAGVVLYEFIAATEGTSWLFHPQPAAGNDFAVFGPTTRALARDIKISLRRGPGEAATAFVTVRVAP